MRSLYRTRFFWLLPISGLLHLALFLSWPVSRPVQSSLPARQAALTVALRSAPEAMIPIQPQAPTAIVKPTPSITPKKVAPPTQTAVIALPRAVSNNPLNIAPTPTPTENDVFESAKSAPTNSKQIFDGGDDLQSLAKRSLGKVDRELRKDAPAHSKERLAALGVPGAAPFEKAIAAAGVQRDIKVETIYGANGQAFTKYSGPGGSYCMWVPKPMSASTEAPKMRVTNCPH